MSFLSLQEFAAWKLPVDLTEDFQDVHDSMGILREDRAPVEEQSNFFTSIFSTKKPRDYPTLAISIWQHSAEDK